MSDSSHEAGGVTAASGTTPVFKRLARGKMTTIRHGSGQFAAVDVYELAFFDAVISADEISSRTSVQFYVYHASDGTAQVRRDGGGVETVVVADSKDPWHIPFEEALRMMGVDYNDETNLGDVVNDFWSALFSPPNDPFEEPAYGVSPWLERNVGDRRSVGSLRPGTGGGEWDDLRLRFRPRKTLNWPAPAPPEASRFPEEPGLIMLLDAIVTYRRGDQSGAWDRALSIHDRLEQMRREHGSGVKEGLIMGRGAPPGVEVVQLDLNTVGLRLLEGGLEEVGVMVVIRP